MAQSKLWSGKGKFERWVEVIPLDDFSWSSLRFRQSITAWPNYWTFDSNVALTRLNSPAASLPWHDICIVGPYVVGCIQWWLSCHTVPSTDAAHPCSEPPLNILHSILCILEAMTIVMRLSSSSSGRGGGGNNVSLNSHSWFASSISVSRYKLLREWMRSYIGSRRVVKASRE